MVNFSRPQLDGLSPFGMQLDKDYFVDRDGNEHDSLLKLLQQYGLNHCGCGTPEANIHFVARVLSVMHKKKPNFDKLIEIIGNVYSVQFVVYALMERGLIYHGQPDSGSRVTPLGEAFLQLARHIPRE